MAPHDWDWDNPLYRTKVSKKSSFDHLTGIELRYSFSSPSSSSRCFSVQYPIAAFLFSLLIYWEPFGEECTIFMLNFVFSSFWVKDLAEISNEVIRNFFFPVCLTLRCWEEFFFTATKQQVKNTRWKACEKVLRSILTELLHNSSAADEFKFERFPSFVEQIVWADFYFDLSWKS